MSNNVKQEIISWIKVIVFSVVLAWCVNSLLLVNANVPTGSMENTIMPKDRILAYRQAYLFHEPERGDIVVFVYPDDPTGETLYVKRIIGLPGETVSVVDGNVYINDSDTPLEEPYLKEKPDELSFGPYTVPEYSYFMMGDNRNSSLDSRYWTNTFMAKKDILGKVFFRYYRGFKIIE